MIWTAAAMPPLSQSGGAATALQLAEACRNRTDLSTLPRRNNGFEDRGSHQTPFASSNAECKMQKCRRAVLNSAFCILHSAFAFTIDRSGEPAGVLRVRSRRNRRQ